MLIFLAIKIIKPEIDFSALNNIRKYLDNALIFSIFTL